MRSAPSIRVDSRGREVMRILPRVNEAVNEEWISDKTRHIVDGLRLQRLDRPFVRVDGRLRPATWQEAFAAIAARVKAARPEAIGAIAGDLAAVEEMFALKSLMQASASPISMRARTARRCRPRLAAASYLFNSTIAGIEEADAILIVGANPRIEAPLVNVRIRKRWRMGPLADRPDRRARRPHLSARISRRRSRRRLPISRPASQLPREAEGAKKPIDHRRARALSRGEDGRRCCRRSAARRTSAPSRGWNGFRVLHTAAVARRRARSRLRAGGGRHRRSPAWRQGALDVVFNLGADEIDIAPGAFVSIRARTAIVALTAPTSSCPVRPTRRNPAPTSTSRGACRWRTARPSRRATPARIGRSFAPCRMSSANAAIRLTQRSPAEALRGISAFRCARQRSPKRCGGGPWRALAAIGGHSWTRGFRQPRAKISTSRTRSPVRRAVMAERSALARQSGASGRVRGTSMELRRHSPQPFDHGRQKPAAAGRPC